MTSILFINFYVFYLVIQAENIYNDEEPDTPAEVEPSTSQMLLVIREEPAGRGKPRWPLAVDNRLLDRCGTTLTWKATALLRLTAIRRPRKQFVISLLQFPFHGRTIWLELCFCDGRQLWPMVVDVNKDVTRKTETLVRTEINL